MGPSTPAETHFTSCRNTISFPSLHSCHSFQDRLLRAAAVEAAAAEAEMAEATGGGGADRRDEDRQAK